MEEKVKESKEKIFSYIEKKVNGHQNGVYFICLDCFHYMNKLKPDFIILLIAMADNNSLWRKRCFDLFIQFFISSLFPFSIHPSSSNM